MTSGTWDPAQYEQFKDERRQPFDDLVALCQPLHGGRAVDLGCGTGELTLALHEVLGAGSTLGVDSSAEMLARAPSAPGLRFVEGHIEDFSDEGLALVFSNAALHWVDDHRSLLTKLRAMVTTGGQLAFQMPANFSHPSHRVAREVAAGDAFASVLPSLPPDRADSLLTLAGYAELLDELGAQGQVVRLAVYGHHLASTEGVVEWVMGSVLSPYRQAMAPEAFAAFVAAYRERLVEVLGHHQPYFYAFPRILCWARFP
jgi:trans-aconitate 2-methyltransferase